MELSVNTKGMRKAYDSQLTDWAEFLGWYTEIITFLRQFRLPLIPTDKMVHDNLMENDWTSERESHEKQSG